MNPTENASATAKTNPKKIELRRRLLSIRGGLAIEWRADASALISKHVLHLIDYFPRPVDTVAVYAHIGHEVETHALIAALLARQLRVALPLALHHPRRLEMRLIDTFPLGLKKSAFGVLEPVPLRHPEVLDPDWIDLALVPGVAFDRKGRRLGYGAGYIDRWLSADRRYLALGLAFGPQIVDAVPTDPWDRPVDGVVTESGIIKAASGRAW